MTRLMLAQDISQREGLIGFRERLETPSDAREFCSALITEVRRLWQRSAYQTEQR